MLPVAADRWIVLCSDSHIENSKNHKKVILTIIT